MTGTTVIPVFTNGEMEAWGSSTTRRGGGRTQIQAVRISSLERVCSLESGGGTCSPGSAADQWRAFGEVTRSLGHTSLTYAVWVTVNLTTLL